MTDTDVAQMLGIHRSTVWRWAKDGRLPAPIRPLRARIARWRVEEIEAAILAHTEQ
ncbi:helix-turn-helix transcriptional regulator [Jannaschia faecimaris]